MARSGELARFIAPGGRLSNPLPFTKHVHLEDQGEYVFHALPTSYPSSRPLSAALLRPRPRPSEDVHPPPAAPRGFLVVL